MHTDYNLEKLIRNEQYHLKHSENNRHYWIPTGDVQSCQSEMLQFEVLVFVTQKTSRILCQKYL
jgi:proteasome assembly chaperone (PAC2) family protein